VYPKRVETTLRVILDSNVVMSGFLWPGICTRFFDLANSGQIDCFTTTDLIAEIDEVLHRAQHAHHVARTGLTAKQLVAHYRRFAQLIPARKLTAQVCRDADDDAVLACALAAHASLIVTGDKDLRVLHPWRGIQILNPLEATLFIEGQAS
jgi:uncharacterized protein